MYQRKWGLMFHYLHGLKEYSAGNLYEPEISWEECVNSFDVKKFVEDVRKVNPGWVMFTVMQGKQFMCAPNETFNKITGYKNGEACSSRDLIAEIADELEKYDIKLILYFTGDGPYIDKSSGYKFGMCSETVIGKSPATVDFVKKWAAVMEEYAVRYGKKVHGWWIDGCYSYVGYTDELLKLYKDAALKGNPDAVVSFNNGTGQPIDNARFVKKVLENPELSGDMMSTARRIAADEGVDVDSLHHHPGPVKYSEYEDYTAGEENDFNFFPKERFDNGSQWHIFSFLGLPNYDCGQDGKAGWGNFGCKYDGEELREIVGKVSEKGGVVTVEARIFRNGSMEKGQLAILKDLADINAK